MVFSGQTVCAPRCAITGVTRAGIPAILTADDQYRRATLVSDQSGTPGRYSPAAKAILTNGLNLSVTTS